MNLHIGTKLIKSIAMDRLGYNIYRGWDLPADEDGSDEGFLVEYLDGGKANHPDHEGYISWSPKEVYDNAYQDVKKGVSFGSAVLLAKLGHRVARTGWNGSGMFVYLVQPGKWSAVSDAIKGVFEDDMVPYRSYWALKTAQNDVATWAPSGSDSLADDWILVEQSGVSAMIGTGGDGPSKPPGGGG